MPSNVKKYLDKDGLLYYNQKLKALLDTKTDKTETTELRALVNSIDAALTAETSARTTADSNLTSALSTETSERTAADSNLTTALSAETSARTSADSALQSDISGLTTALGTEVSNRTSADSALQSDIDAVETSLDTLSSNVYRKTEVYTKGETDTAISTAIGSITQIRYEIVQELPQVGENGVIYLVLYAEGPQGNIYQEWIWLSSANRYETLGSTNQIDLTNYVTFDDLSAITNQEIDTIVDNAFAPVVPDDSEDDSNDSGN